MKMQKSQLLIAPPPYNRKTFRRLNKNHCGFTLAETLITLAIIGIIAALTVPTLLSKYHDHVTVTQVKKFNSLLANASQLLFPVNNCPAGDLECTGFTDENLTYDGITFEDLSAKKLYMLSKQLKKSYFCSDTYDTDKVKCDKIRNTYDITIDTGISLSGLSAYVITNDGILITPMGFYVSWGAGDIGFRVQADINSVTKPNKLGKDIFAFYIAEQTKNGVVAGTAFPYKSNQHVDYLNMNYSDIDDLRPFTCGNNSIWTDNLDCAAKIIKENAINYKLK